MTKKKKDSLVALFKQWAGEEAENFIMLPQSGSYREYYRLIGKTKTAIGVFNADKKENIAFVSFTRQFLNANLPVPKILAEYLDHDVYLLEDLGDITLFSMLQEMRTAEEFPVKVIELYKKILERLPDFQITAGKAIDYTVCYPRQSFDRQSMMWDMNYFKYYFLKLAKIPFDEQALETDFNTFADYLLTADSTYFLYRDFQSRNVMIKDGEPYFIDYQGGRQGALHYDLASLLFDAKANLPHPVRRELLHYYISVLKKYIDVDERIFIQTFFGFVLIRVMQAMGAYGFRGMYEKKEHFLKSIPFAVDNLNWLLNAVNFPVPMPELLKALQAIAASDAFEHYREIPKQDDKLEISIYSFSYKQAIPQDMSGNGGGFVFDCRGLHNPGRYFEYKHLSGKDEAVQKFLEEKSDVEGFLSHIFAIVDQYVDVYTARKFNHLMISFGCTGGQHRSVYCAERLAKHLKTKSGITVKLRHIEQEKREAV